MPPIPGLLGFSVMSRTGRIAYHPWRPTQDSIHLEDSEWYKTSIYTLCVRLDFASSPSLPDAEFHDCVFPHEQLLVEVFLVHASDLSTVDGGLQSHKAGPFVVAKRGPGVFSGEVGPFSPAKFSFRHSYRDSGANVSSGSSGDGAAALSTSDQQLQQQQQQQQQHPRFRLRLDLSCQSDNNDASPPDGKKKCIWSTYSPPFIVKSKKPRRNASQVDESSICMSSSSPGPSADPSAMVDSMMEPPLAKYPKPGGGYPFAVSSPALLLAGGGAGAGLAPTAREGATAPAYGGVVIPFARRSSLCSEPSAVGGFSRFYSVIAGSKRTEASSGSSH